VFKRRTANLIVKVVLAIFFIFALYYFSCQYFKPIPGKVISLQAGEFEHIQFSTKQPNTYRYFENELVIEVDNSASFLMRAFDTVKYVDDVSFEWRSSGRPAVADSDHETQRGGDDAVFKLGLLIETEDTLDDVFLPSWMRRVDELLHFHSGKMFFLVVDARHHAEQTWPGPYNRRMTMISMQSGPEFQGWNRVSYQFSAPVKVVAIWLMADGDDTSSSFTTHVRNISIK
jgi:hypothetical protein